jgi:hypothetical protein
VGLVGLEWTSDSRVSGFFLYYREVFSIPTDHDILRIDYSPSPAQACLSILRLLHTILLQLVRLVLLDSATPGLPCAWINQESSPE